MNKETLGKFIAEIRRERDMTQQMLAERLHVTNTAVSKWERGLCYPDLTLLESLADTLGLTVGELMACQKKTAACPESENVKSLLDIAGESQRRQKRRIWLTAILVPLALMLLCGLLFWLANAQSHHTAEGIFTGKQATPEGCYVYFERKGILYRLQCPDQQTYDRIQTDGRQLYRFEYNWNSITGKGDLLLCEAVRSSGVLGTPMDELGSTIGIGSLLGVDQVFKSIQNVYPDPDRPGKYLYTFRFYYCVGTDAIQIPIVTVEDCRSTVSADHDHDGVTELFVLTKHENAPYMLCELKQGQVEFLFVDDLPAEILNDLKAMSFDK